MSYRRSLIRLVKYGTVGGIVATGVSLYLPETTQHLRKVSQRFSLNAKSEDVDLYPGQARGAKWDNNWDCRDPTSLVKPLKENATDEEKVMVVYHTLYRELIRVSDNSQWPH